MYLLILGILIVIDVSNLIRPIKSLLNKDKLKADYEELRSDLAYLSTSLGISSGSIIKIILAFIYVLSFVIALILWLLSSNYYQAQSIHFILILLVIYYLVDALGIPTFLNNLQEYNLKGYYIQSWWNLVSAVIELLIMVILFVLYFV